MIANPATNASDLEIGPWSGINNAIAPDRQVFQPSKDGSSRPSLVSASNVDLTDDGWPRSRPSLALDTALSNGLGGWEVGGRLFFQDGVTLYERAATDAALITGLSYRAALAEHWGKVYVTDGAKHWEIDGTSVRSWGLPIPTLAGLTQGAGSLYAPGKYLVRAAFVDANSNEGGVSPTYEIELSGTAGTAAKPAQEGGIALSVQGATADVVQVNLYVSEANQKTTSFAGVVPIDSANDVLITGIESIGDPPRTEFMQGPITNADGLCSFRAFMLMWRENYIFRSEAAQPHLFHRLSVMQFPDAVVGAEGVAGGLWVATARGLWWVTGESPEQWVPVRKTTTPVLAGSMLISGAHIPRLQTDGLVALFATETGLVAGMPDGITMNMTENVYRFPSGSRASFSYVERDGLHQILIGITE